MRLSKNVQIKGMHIQYTVTLTPDILEELPDPQMKEAIREYMGPVRFHHWTQSFENGHGKAIRITNTVHMKDMVKGWFSSPERLGTVIGTFIALGMIVGTIAALGMGIYTVGKFILNLL